MKKNLLSKLLLFSFPLILVFTSHNSQAQIVLTKKAKRSNTVIFRAPQRTRPIVETRENLPPGQAKKIYGTKSAKPFAPGQRKKEYHTSWANYDHEGKHEDHGKKEKYDRD